MAKKEEMVKVEKGDTEAYEKHKRQYCLQWCPKHCNGSCGVQLDENSTSHVGPHTCWKCYHSWGS
jgi:hypothetical protein